MRFNEISGGGDIGYIYERNIVVAAAAAVIIEEAGHVIKIMTKCSSGMTLSSQLSAAKTPNAQLSFSSHRRSDRRWVK